MMPLAAASASISSSGSCSACRFQVWGLSGKMERPQGVFRVRRRRCPYGCCCWLCLSCDSMHSRDAWMLCGRAAGHMSHREEVWHPLLGLLQQVLQIQQDALTALPAVDKGGGNTRLATATLHTAQHTSRPCPTRYLDEIRQPCTAPTRQALDASPHASCSAPSYMCASQQQHLPCVQFCARSFQSPQACRS